MQLRAAEDYVRQFGNLAKAANTLIVPANLSDVASMIAMVAKVFEHGSADRGTIGNAGNGPADRSPA